MFRILKSALTEKSCEGSSERLLQLCFGYFGFYVLNGIAVKYFTAKDPVSGLAKMTDVAYLVYSGMGSMTICVLIVLALKWYKLKSTHDVTVFGTKMPAEYLYIIPSGICTAVVIPTTTMMYTLPISVMVAMVIMRATVIVISRLVDSVQVAQGILHKKVYWEENMAVVFAIIAACINLFSAKGKDFDFVHNKPAMIILTAYIIAYAIRIYIMNYYKNTRPKGTPQHNEGFFAVEQITAFVTTVVIAVLAFKMLPDTMDPKNFINLYHDSINNCPADWMGAVVGGLPYGAAAFFSVFLFMFKGRTATFAGVVNRLTSLIAGTAATLLAVPLLGAKMPKNSEWVSLAFIMIAIFFLTRAEKRRTAELLAAREIEKVC